MANKITFSLSDPEYKLKELAEKEKPKELGTAPPSRMNSLPEVIIEEESLDSQEPSAVDIVSQLEKIANEIVKGD